MPLRTLALLIGFLFISQNTTAEELYPYVAHVIEDNVQLRSGQSKNFESLLILNTGDELTVLDREYSWNKVELPKGAKLFIHTNFVQMIDGGQGIITANRVNIRAGRGVAYSVVTQLSEGETIRVLEVKEDWIQFEPLDNMTGWVHQDFIKFVKRLDKKNTKKTDIASKEKKSNSSSKVKRYDESISVVGKISEVSFSEDSIYHKITLDDTTEFFIKGYKHLMDEFIGYRVSIDADVYKGPLSKAYPKAVLDIIKVKLVL